MITSLRRIVLAAASTLSLATLPGTARATEYCVTCEGPNAIYRCVVEGTPDGPGTNPSASLLCISEMAARGHHERCAVSRGAPFPCPGLTATIAAQPDLPANPQSSADAPAGPPVTEGHPSEAVGQEEENAAGVPPASAPSKVPQTMEELAGQTMRSSKEGLAKAGEAIGGTAKKAGEHIGNAGSAIGNAASKTWGCVTSFFQHCGSGSGTEETPPQQQPAE